jgi:hypothetical protein
MEMWVGHVREGTLMEMGPVDGSDIFLRNVCNHLQAYTAAQPRIPQSIKLFGVDTILKLHWIQRQIQEDTIL